MVEQLHRTRGRSCIGDRVMDFDRRGTGPESHASLELERVDQEPRFDDCTDDIQGSLLGVDLDPQLASWKVGDATVNRVDDFAVTVEIGGSVAEQAASYEQLIETFKPSDSRRVSDRDQGRMHWTGHWALPAELDPLDPALPDPHASHRQDDRSHRLGVDGQALHTERFAGVPGGPVEADGSIGQLDLLGDRIG